MPKSSIESRMPSRSSACSLATACSGLRMMLLSVSSRSRSAGSRVGGLDHLGDAAHEVVLLELPAGQVDREAQVGEAEFLPGPDLSTGGAEHPVPELDDQPRFLGERYELGRRDQA